MPGAAVSFHLPEEGPGGAFANGLRTEVAVTDAQGRVALHGLQVNRVPGRFQIRVIANKEQARAGVVSSQYVAEPRSGAASTPAAPREPRTRWVAVAALVAGGAAAGILSGGPKSRRPLPQRAGNAGGGGRHGTADLDRNSGHHGGAAMKWLPSVLATGRAFRLLPGGVRPVFALPGGWQRRTSGGGGARYGSGRAGGNGTALFRLRNTSRGRRRRSRSLAVRGTGFSLAGAPAMPVGLASQQAIEFTVVFQANAVGAYSAALDSEGIAVIVTATVVPSLTFQVDGATLSSAGLNFGTVEVDTPVSRRVTVTNLTSLPFIVPPISIAGRRVYALAARPSGALLQPLDTASFDILFQPSGVGTWTGALSYRRPCVPVDAARRSARRCPGRFWRSILPNRAATGKDQSP